MFDLEILDTEALEEVAQRIGVALEPVAPEDRLGFLMGVVAGILYTQGFDTSEKMQAEFERVIVIAFKKQTVQ